MTVTDIDNELECIVICFDFGVRWDALCNQAEWRKQGRPAERWEDDLNAYLQLTITNRHNNAFTSDTTWLTTAQDGSE